ncbi:MAG: hypothetical protein F6K11_03280 [Leptolyngbya sp. SIO3F4]|nr:hypothetical protein [Leptolyngbya sp. SIO3F4]
MNIDPTVRLLLILREGLNGNNTDTPVFDATALAPFEFLGLSGWTFIFLFVYGTLVCSYLVLRAFQRKLWTRGSFTMLLITGTILAVTYGVSLIIALNFEYIQSWVMQ